jgi:5-methylcytosine-specific restriction endonuclease McrA
VQDDLEKLAGRLINDLDMPRLQGHRAEKKRIDKYYAPRQRFNRWRDSDEGKTWKQKQFKVTGGKCPECPATFLDSSHFVIDHIKPLCNHPNLALDLSNLRLLCHSCNLKKGANEAE